MMLKESFHHKFKHPFGIVLLILVAAGIYAYTQYEGGAASQCHFSESQNNC